MNEENLNNEQENRHNYSYFAPPRQESDKTTKWKIDPEDVISEITHYLKGDFFDKNEQSWKPLGAVYEFFIKSTPEIHQELIKADNNGLLRFETVFVDKNIDEGQYTLTDIQSFNELISFLETNKIIYRFEKKEPHRMINDTGLRVITTRLRTYLNKNVILSNLSDEMILKMALENALETSKLIFMAHDKYGIKKENFSTVLRILDTNVYTALMRAKFGFFVNHLSTTQRYIEQSNVTSENISKEQKKTMPNLFNWRR